MPASAFVRRIVDSAAFIIASSVPILTSRYTILLPPSVIPVWAIDQHQQQQPTHHRPPHNDSTTSGSGGAYRHMGRCKWACWFTTTCAAKAVEGTGASAGGGVGSNHWNPVGDAAQLATTVAMTTPMPTQQHFPKTTLSKTQFQAHTASQPAEIPGSNRTKTSHALENAMSAN